MSKADERWKLVEQYIESSSIDAVRFNHCMLAVARERAGLTRGNLAAIVGVDPSAVARWEDGACVPDGLNLLKILLVLDLPLNSLLSSHSIFPFKKS